MGEEGGGSVLAFGGARVTAGAEEERRTWQEAKGIGKK